MNTASNFADRLLASSRRLRAPIVAGIDPRPDLLSSELLSKCGSQGSDLASGYAEFGEQILTALSGVVPAIKVQVAFFEALGVAGLRAYAKVVRTARELGFLVIGDIKRADIGTTAEAYAEGHLTPGGDFEVDAVTVNPYLGEDGIAPFRALCEKHGKGLFVLVRTSNPSARDVQDLVADGRPIFEHVSDLVARWGSSVVGAEGSSSIGAVVGATYPRELVAIRARHPRLLLLVPGYGAQGGSAGDVVSALDDRFSGALIASSRGLLRAFRAAADAGAAPGPAVRRAAEEMRDALHSAWKSSRATRGQNA